MFFAFSLDLVGFSPGIASGDRKRFPVCADTPFNVTFWRAVMSDNRKIASARITAMPEKMFDPMPQVYVKFEDGKEELLFDYYPDEISFTAEEFVGLTVSEAISLKFKKDKGYLSS
jgi:hypothetical protein